VGRAVGRPLPLGNKAGGRAVRSRGFSQQFLVRPFAIGAAQVGASATQPIASSTFARFNSQFRVLPRTADAQANFPRAAGDDLNLLRKRMKQARKTANPRRRK
jgi:hypothetical protein